MKRLLTICAFLAIASSCYGQGNRGFFLKGQLIDSVTKAPLAFASIVVINKNQGIASSPEGTFEIPVSLGDSIKVSSVGYADYFFQVTVDMRKSGVAKTIELTQQALALDDFVIFQMSDDFYLKRKVLDTLPPPVRGLGYASLPLIGIPSKYVPIEDQPFQLFSKSIPIFQEISKNPKQARIIRKMEEATAFQVNRQKERDKYFNKALVKRITRIDDRVIDEFMTFCNFLDGEILGRSEFDISQKILIKYQAFLRR